VATGFVNSFAVVGQAMGWTLMTNIGAVYTDDEAELDWFRRSCFPSLMFETAEEMATSPAPFTRGNYQW
jgi:hypothetical protein